MLACRGLDLAIDGEVICLQGRETLLVKIGQLRASSTGDAF